MVSPADPAFARPTKPIGPVYAAAEIEALKARHGWAFAPDGAGMRRVVASPMPVGIVELPIIAQLVDAKVIVVCAGGGGIPVCANTQGALEGVEAVVDKDHAAALLAERLGAERLIILTDVDGVYRDWGEAGQRRIERAAAAALQAEAFAEGSMAPKVAAACRFAARTGGVAAIGALGAAEAVAALAAGTVIAR